MTQFLNVPIDKSLGATGVWTDIDLSSDIPAHATGAVFQIINTDDGDDHTFGLRKNGSSDDRCKGIDPDAQVFMIVGVDENQICEGRQNSNYLDFYLVGYTESDAILFTNGYDKSQTTLATWTDLDLSSELPVGSVAAIFEVYNNGLSSKSWGLQKKGSTDNRYDDLGGLCHVYFITGIDANRKCQFKIESSDIDFFLLGYLKSGIAETNGVDRSLGSTGSYIDITESDAPTGAAGAFVEFDTSTVSGAFGARKNGIIWDKYHLPPAKKSMILVGLDESKKWEGKIATTNHDFYTLGYFASTVEWLSGYTYRKKGAVNATTAGAQTNYQLKLVVGESSGASGEDVDCESHCADFPNDIRFTKEDGTTKHDYWIDIHSLTGTTPNRKVDVYIAVASTPASGSVEFYIYYGKSSDSGESNGRTTFGLFENFDYKKSFSRKSYGTLWSGSGSEDWLGRPVLLDNNGTWIAVYRQAASHLWHTAAKFHIRFSTDQGTNWTTVDTYTDSNPVSGFPLQGHNSVSIADAIIMKAQNGDLLIHACECTLAGLYAGTYQYRSTNNGATWTDEGKINADNGLLGGQDYVIVGSTIYITVFVDPNNDGNSPYYTALYKSVNNGTSWTLVSNITSTTEGTNEAGIEYLGGNTLLAIIRDDSGVKTYQRISTDMGVNWGSLTDITSYVSVVQRPRLRIFDDEPNRTYLFGRQKSTNSYTVLYYSMDDGATWIEQFYPDTSSYTDTGYCDLLKKTNGDFYMLSYGGSMNAASIKKYIFEKTTVALDPSKWVTVGTPTITFANSILSMECDAEEWIESKTYTQSPPAKLCVRSKDKDFGVKNYPATYGWGDYSDPVDSDGVRREIYSTATFCLAACNSSTAKYTAGIARNTNFANYKLTWRTAICHIYEDDVKKDADDITSSIPTGALDVRIGRGYKEASAELNKFDVDWIFTCKYASPEPTWGSWGAEETAPGAPGYEDFTTFTEVDVGADRIQKTANHIDHLSYRNETTYLYKDYGVDHFTDFTHKIKIKLISSSVAWSASHTWLIANDIAGASWMESNNKTYISAFLLTDGSNIPRIILREMYNGSPTDDYYVCSLGTWYYLRIVKSGTTLTAYIYSDSDYSILLDTLVITLHADHNLRYLYGCNSDNDGNNRNVVLDIENFDLDSAITKESSVGLRIVERHTKASSAGLSIQETKTKTSTVGLRIVERHTKASSAGLSIQETKTKTSTVGLRIVERHTKASSAGLRIIARPTKISTVSLSILECLTKTSSVSLSISGEGENISTLGLTIVNRITKESSAGLTVIGANTKESSIGVSILEQNVKASSVGLSIIAQKTKASSVGMRVVSQETKASSVSLTVFDTPIKNSSIGLDVRNPKTKESSIGMFISGYNTKESSIGLHIYEPACAKGLFYGKLGDIILEAIDPESFRISEEINKIPSFEFEVANSEVNRTAIAANPTALFKIYWQHHGIENHIFTGIINADGIEYVSLTNIRITGFSSYVKLGWPLFKYLNAEDAEPVNTVFDFHGTYTDYTTQANNATINDVFVTLGGVNHCLYVGEANPFWGLQIKYSTPGVSAGANIIIEYSKGSGIWAELNVLDETYAFTKPAGTYDFIIAHPPSDWVRNTINGVSKFWLRWRVVSGGYTTSPKLDQIHTVNVDVYRVFYIATSARAILLDVLEGTEYTMDAIDVCPEDEVNIFAEYESPLRVIAAIPAALTWTDGDGNKKAYQWWIDEAKKVHIKKKRGTTHSDDITGDLTIFNNLIDYFNVSNRLIGFSKRDGLSQIRAIVEDRTSQTTHALREFPVPKTDIGKYITLKEGLEKDIAISKDPMQRIKGSVTTEFWEKRGYTVGDTVTLHQGEWVVEEGEFQIVKVDKGPLLTQLNLGISREHLEGLKSNLKRTFDISNVQMHGSTSLLTAGPETSNYERKSDGSVFASKLKIEIPSEVIKTHKVLLSWTIGPYRASVNESTGEIPGHDHDGFAGAGGAIAGGFAGAGGDFTPDVMLDGDFWPEMLSEAHVHDLSDTLSIDFGEIIINSVANEGVIEGLNHRHTGGATGYSNDNAYAIDELFGGTACADGWCINNSEGRYFATDYHYHQNSDTGYTDPNAYIEYHPIYVVFTIHPYVLQTASLTEDPAHLHDGVYEPDHDHVGVYEPAHSDHTIPAEPAHSDHIIVTEPGTNVDIDYGIHEEAAGTVLELIVSGEKIGEYSGNQTQIRIDGYLSSATNTIEIQPISTELSKKGSATIVASGILFIEPKKF